MARRRLKWEPVCHWCRSDMPENDGWRTPMMSRGDDYAQGLLAGWVVCGPDCRSRPEDAVVYRKDEL